MADGGKEAVSVGEDVVGSSGLRVVEKRIRELERVFSKKTLDNEILRDPVWVANKKMYDPPHRYNISLKTASPVRKNMSGCF
jgi:hypothetical protein